MCDFGAPVCKKPNFYKSGFCKNCYYWTYSHGKRTPNQEMKYIGKVELMQARIARKYGKHRRRKAS